MLGQGMASFAVFLIDSRRMGDLRIGRVQCNVNLSRFFGSPTRFKPNPVDLCA